ncbi:CoA-transferase, partial [Chloroflexota bacterium]
NGSYAGKGVIIMDDRAKLVEKYNTDKLGLETIALRVTREFKDGDIVNLGRGIPGLVGNFVPQGVDIFWHGENGILGYGTAITLDEWEEIDNDVHNSSIQHVRELPGMAMFDFGEAFTMLRGKHVDAGVLGGFQVSEKGDFANWAFEYPVPNWGIGIGGAFELVIGPKRCIVTITHLDKYGNSKVVKELTMPLTGAPQQVDLIVTDLAVIEVKGEKGRKEGLLLKEVAPGWTIEEVTTLTGFEMEVAPDFQVYQL